MLSQDPRRAGHPVPAPQSGELQQRRGDIGQDTVGEPDAPGGTADQDERHGVERMRRDGVALRVPQLVGVPVVGRDGEERTRPVGIAGVEAADPDGPGAILAITADHGNADDLRDGEGNPVTAHSLNPVPFVLIGRSVASRSVHDGVLADVAPTLLELAGLPTWSAITGHSLLGPDGGGATPVIASAAERTEVPRT